MFASVFFLKRLYSIFVLYVSSSNNIIFPLVNNEIFFLLSPCSSPYTGWDSDRPL